MVTYLREPTTIDEQISILKEREMIFNDDNLEDVRRNLLDVGYFRFKGYCLDHYRAVDIFKEGTKFDTIYNIYRFDERLRLLLFQLIEHLEFSYKAQIGHHFSLECGALGHYAESNFSDGLLHTSWIENLEKAISYSEKRNESYSSHYKQEYDGDFPVWVAFELSNLTDISKFYSNINGKLKNEIAKKTCGYRREYLSSWLQSISVIRNICAHGGRLYNRNLPIFPKLDKRSQKKFEINKIFACIYIMKNMCCNDNYWSLFQRNLQILVDIYIDDIDISKIGFPENWRELLQ